MIGQRVVFLEDFEFNGKLYKKGHQFTITDGSNEYNDGMRGAQLLAHLSLNIFLIYGGKFELISKLREDKLKELGI